MSTQQSRKLVLTLYKQLLREGSKFPAYNFRKYAHRRTRDAFRDNKSLADKSLIEKSIQEAKDNLQLIRRQVIVGTLYQADKLIIEK